MTSSTQINEISLSRNPSAERWQHDPMVQSQASPEPASELSSMAKKGSWTDDPRLPACLVSTILHTILLLMLALWGFVPSGGSDAMLIVRIESPSDSAAKTQVTQIKTFDATTLGKQNEDFEKPMESVDAVINALAKPRYAPISPPSATSIASTQANQSPDVESSFDPTHLSTTSLPFVRLPSSSSLAGRSGDERRRVGEQNGATKESEEAVERALAWLAEHQRSNGAWSFDLTGQPCDGRCRNSKLRDDDTPTPSTAATGLALLAFLGAGYTHEDGKYADVVQKGLYYLRSAGAESQYGIDWQQGSMYGHGIALMAVSEAAAMTIKNEEYDRDLRELARRGTNFTTSAQHQSGSWGYVPGSPGDTTLTGWQVLSLMAAKRNQIPLPSPTLSRAKSFILSTSLEGQYSFGYQAPPGEPTTTAIGLTLLLYLGQSPGYTPFDNAILAMAQRGPTLTNLYHDYYATLALHHVQNPLFAPYFMKVREHLISTQARVGHEQGSWHFKDRWGDVGGRVYSTAMSAMILEVPYRYMPLYDTRQDFPL